MTARKTSTAKTPRNAPTGRSAANGGSRRSSSTSEGSEAFYDPSMTAFPEFFDEAPAPRTRRKAPTGRSAAKETPAKAPATRGPPKGRYKPKYENEPGLVIYGHELGDGGAFSRRRAKRKLRAEYADAHRVEYSSECELEPTRRARKKCYRDLNRGL